MSITETRSNLALWRIAEAFLQTFFALFGPPERIAAQHTLTHKPRALLLTWLRAGEALLRRLLLIEATHIVAPNAPPQTRLARKRERKLMGFTPEQPEKWRVSFRCLHLPPRRGGSAAPRSGKAKGDIAKRSATRAPSDACGVSSPASGGDKKHISREDRWSFENFAPVRFYSAWPLAERVEAMLRVFNNPAPYAKRLAHRLHRAPKRALELLKHTESDRNLVGRESFDQIRDAAYAALKPPNSS